MIIIGYILLLPGAVLMFLGVLGIVRMPDVFNKLQAGIKAATLGLILIVLGIFFIRPAWWGKLLLIASFVLLTNPIRSHNLSRAVHGNWEEMDITEKERTMHFGEGD